MEPEDEFDSHYEEGEIIRKHFVDSISLVKAFPGQLGEGELRLMDVGTGLVFPVFL